MKSTFGVSDQVVMSMGRGASPSDELKVTGRVHLELRGPDGALKEVRDIDNLVVNVGKTHIRDLLQDKSTPTEMSHIALGSGNTAAAATDTQLQTEYNPTERKATVRTDSGSFGVIHTTTWNAGEATQSAIVEAGIFNSGTLSSGTMLARVVFSAIAKGASDTLTIAWTVTIS